LRLPVRDLSGMDWNAKTLSQWDYESCVLFNSNVAGTPRLTQSSEWGMENGSIYSSGGGVCSGSEVGNGCSSKSSLSASIDSAPRAGPRVSMINFETASKDTEKKEEGKVKEIRNTPELTGSVGSVEPLIGLKLGKRTYFEDFYTESNMENQSFPDVPVPTSTSAKKARVSSQGSQKTRCQVEGCNLDLATAKSYHRKHRVCEGHSKCAVVIVAGQERRFCQQCSRFHGLAEFDQKKRSCRRRLYNHNARRRRPPPDAISHNSARVSSSLYGANTLMAHCLVCHSYEANGHVTASTAARHHVVASTSKSHLCHSRKLSQSESVAELAGLSDDATWVDLGA
ncbi:hypothetical protein Taro_042835, partial [Colocasia esculenta]|nr:hypothetical protein [Colocasia esculenta]